MYVCIAWTVYSKYNKMFIIIIFEYIFENKQQSTVTAFNNIIITIIPYTRMLISYKNML